MNNKKSAFLITSVLTIILLLYLGLRFILPVIITNKSVINRLETMIYSRTGIKINAGNFQVKITPLLVAEIKAKKITAINDQKILFDIDDLQIIVNPAKFAIKNIEAENIFFDKTALPASKKTESGDFKLKSLPQVHIKNTYVVLERYAQDKLFTAEISELSLKKEVSFRAKIKNPKIKHDIIINSDNNVLFEKNTLFFKDLIINVENANLYTNGYLNSDGYNFDIKGNDFCVNALEKAFLFFIKQKNHSKNFIENFYDFSGKADIKLNIASNSINGSITAKNLKAKTVKFSVPLSFPVADFIFKDDTIKLNANGILGGEPVYTDLDIKNLFDDKTISGSVKTTFTKSFFNKYIPSYELNGKMDFLLNYSVYNHKITVEYLANLYKGTKLKYKNSDLGLSDHNRRIYAKTFKDGSKMYLKTYDYSLTDNDNIKNIITGDGLFVKKNDHFNLDYITCKTNGDAPVSIIGSFSRFVAGGTFNGNLKYKGDNTLPVGNFRLNNSRYKNFYIKEAEINANDDNAEITAEGTYENEPYKALLNVDNNFENKITVNDIDLYLKKFTIKKQKSDGINKKTIITDEMKENIRDLEWEIKKGHIKLDEIRHNEIVINNAELLINGNNNLVHFTMPGTKFAEGILSAEGKYDLSQNNSDICFIADKINSNLAAGMVFGLYNQVEGYANAKMQFNSFNKLDSIKAHSVFLIEDGALTKIGSTEFMIKGKKNNRRINFKLSDIINVDIKKMEALKSNIFGSIDIVDHRIENAELYAKHQYLSLFIEGDYDIDEQDANLNIWGAYNKDAQKGIKILFVPLSLITKVILRTEESTEMYQKKINKIPSIDADKTQKEIFRVNLNGNLNETSSIKVKMKRLK